MNALKTPIGREKNTAPLPPETVDSIKAVLPKQVIWTDPYLFDTTIVLSIKYDTVNYQIQLFFDDTTNANPYDQLAATYTLQ